MSLSEQLECSIGTLERNGLTSSAQTLRGAADRIFDLERQLAESLRMLLEAAGKEQDRQIAERGEFVWCAPVEVAGYSDLLYMHTSAPVPNSDAFRLYTIPQVPEG